MPYDQAYTYVAPDGAAARMYVYQPRLGWRWVGAPWVIGVGPAPFWGRVGPARFAWYAHPWFGVGVRHGWWGPHYYRRGRYYRHHRW